MYESFDISTSTGTYAVDIEPERLAGRLTRHLGDSGRDIVIADRFFEDSLLPLAHSFRAVLCYDATESIKSLDAAPALIEQIRRSGASRQTQFVAMGGGVIQDLAAFAASIYMRGVPWTYIPTTVLGMVDSCIGGKSSINVGPYKNLVGTFHPPRRVYIDPALARTLPREHQVSGIIEAAKICFCRGSDIFSTYIECNPGPDMETAALAALVSQSLRAKKWFIEVDEFDQRERLLLNFGHTFGHAIEGASHYAIPHGTAVGLGILCALTFGRQRSERSDVYAETPIVGVLEDHLYKMLHSVLTLPGELAQLRMDEVMERFESDKKHKEDKYVLILVDPSGVVFLDKVEKSLDSIASIRVAIESVIESFSGNRVR